MSTHTQHMQQRLAEAQAGDEAAATEVAIYVFNTYRNRVRHFFSVDPATTMDDLEMTFFEGIMRAIPLADGRGDDFYHIGQRGVWAVMSEIRSLRQIMDRRALLPMTPDEDGEGADGMDGVEDPSSDFREIVHERIGAQQVVKVFANACLKPRSQQALDVILQYGLDPSEPGFNKTLAAHIGVSPQRSSQICNDLREALAGARESL